MTKRLPLILWLMASVCLTAVVPEATAADTDITLSVDGKPALVLKAPGVAKVTSSNGYVKVVTTDMSLHVWAVAGAKSVKDALPRVPELIKSEFLHFKITGSMDMPIAGATGKHISGSGNEADDGDPGNAQVVLFVVGGKVFAACVHGEADDSTRALPHMMSVLQTAQPAP